jgi:membrane peptidoglycan carboxypeptidase
VAAFPGQPNPWLTLGKLVAALVAAGVMVAGMALPFVGGLGLVAGHYSAKFDNTACTLQESKPPQRTTIYARDGKTVIATLFSQDRVPVALSQIPQFVQNALIATEDRRFYSHHGVDMRGLLRSAVSTSSGATQGGSTLTMQYVKQIRYYQAGDDVQKQQAAIDVNLSRKIEDAKCALYLENTLHHSKARILDDYLNIAFFGEHSYGIQTAAETYFNKSASKLSLGESALLVGMLRAPSAYDPFHNRAAAKQRRDEVLQNLVAVGKLSQTAADKQKALPIALATDSPPQVKQGCANASTTVRNAAFFCEYARNWLETVGNISAAQLQTGGLKIVTTLDPKLQNSAQRQIEQAVPASSPATAVLPVVDPRNGDILAMATSKRYGAVGKSETEQPVFSSHTAQGASTFKLFPLLTALSTGVPQDWTLETAGNGAQYNTKNCVTPSNSTNGDADEFYNLNESLQSATVKSSNTFYVGLADQLFSCHLGPMVSLAQKMGISSLGQPGDGRNLTTAQEIVGQQRAQQFVLGSVPTSPLELAGAYAAVANGGKYNAPAPVLSITDSSNNALPVKRSPAVQVVAPQVAAQAVQILVGDTKTPGTSATPFQSWYSSGNQSVIAGKTGTVGAVNSQGKPSSQNAAVWFVGMTPNLVATSALINFDTPNRALTGLPNIGNGLAYGKYASGVWLKALQPSLQQQSWTWPDPNLVPGNDVPSVQGMDLASAQRTLAGSGYKMKQIDGDQTRCPSSAGLDTIGYYGPHRATPGTTILVCLSTGKSQPVYVAPAPPPVKPKTPATTPTSGSTTAHGRGASPSPPGGNRTPGG